MSATQITLGLPGFSPEEQPTKKGIEARHFSSSGHRLRGVAVRNGRLTGHDHSNREHEVARTVAYNLDGSRHRCNSACQHAKGKDCECSCGGAFHGKGRIARLGALTLF